MVKKFEDTCNRLDTLPACERRTDRQTSCDGIVRGMHMCRAVKSTEVIGFVKKYFHQKQRTHIKHNVEVVPLMQTGN